MGISLLNGVAKMDCVGFPQLRIKVNIIETQSHASGS